MLTYKIGVLLQSCISSFSSDSQQSTSSNNSFCQGVIVVQPFLSSCFKALGSLSCCLFAYCRFLMLLAKRKISLFLFGGMLQGFFIQQFHTRMQCVDCYQLHNAFIRLELAAVVLSLDKSLKCNCYHVIKDASFSKTGVRGILKEIREMVYNVLVPVFLCSGAFKSSLIYMYFFFEILKQ